MSDPGLHFFPPSSLENLELSPVEYVELILKREFLKYLPAIFHIQETLLYVNARLEMDLITPLDLEKNLGYTWKQHL